MVDDSEKLRRCLQTTGRNVEELAEAIGDSPLRLYRVLNGEDALGRTTELALIALKSGLKPVGAGD